MLKITVAIKNKAKNKKQIIMLYSGNEKKIPKTTEQYLKKKVNIKLFGKQK